MPVDTKIKGFVECDIHVPIKLQDKFSEMAPIFKNTDVSRDNLSNDMREFAKRHGHFKRPQCMLVGSLKATKILLLSELVRWYLNHGLKISKIYQLIEYTPKKSFEAFGLSVSEARRLGDIDPTKS